MPERLHSRYTRSAASPTFRIIKASSTQYQNSLFPKCTTFFNTQIPNFTSSEYTAQLNHFRKKCNKEQNGYYHGFQIRSGCSFSVTSEIQQPEQTLVL